MVRSTTPWLGVVSDHSAGMDSVCAHRRVLPRSECLSWDSLGDGFHGGRRPCALRVLLVDIGTTAECVKDTSDSKGLLTKGDHFPSRRRRASRFSPRNWRERPRTSAATGRTTKSMPYAEVDVHRGATTTTLGVGLVNRGPCVVALIIRWGHLQKGGETSRTVVDSCLNVQRAGGVIDYETGR